MARSVLSLLSLCLTILVFATGYPTDKGKTKRFGEEVQYLKRQTTHEPRLRALLPQHDAVREAQHELLENAPQTAQLQFAVRRKRFTDTTAPLDMLAEASEAAKETEPVADSQHFFPSFSPLFHPLGHSRPPFYQEQTFNPRAAYKPHDNFGYGSGSFRDYSFPQATAESDRSANVLGSGNFGVLRGGTYYPGENDELLNDDIYNNYYNNGHGRPSFYPANPLPSFRQGGDFFANFKDFADISTPTKSSYSEFYVVYVNPNATNPEHHSDSSSHGSAPRNIFEQLQIADAEERPQKKLSKAKLKLEKFKTHEQTKELSKKQKVQSSPKEMYEPLLALS